MSWATWDGELPVRTRREGLDEMHYFHRSGTRSQTVAASGVAVGPFTVNIQAGQNPLRVRDDRAMIKPAGPICSPCCPAMWLQDQVAGGGLG